MFNYDIDFTVVIFIISALNDFKEAIMLSVIMSVVTGSCIFVFCRGLEPVRYLV